MSTMAVVVIIAVVVALLVLGLLGTAVAVLVAWLRGLWHEFRTTPMVSGIAQSASVARPLVQYRDVLRLAPPEATAQTVRIQRKALALERVRDHLEAEDRFHVEETTRRYLPDTMNAYRLAVTGASGEQRSAAAQLLMKQLAQLEETVDTAARGAGEVGMRALRANGQFLEQISDDEPSAELPPPDDQPSS
ncbi:MAG: hypothetical protein J2P43_06430 [Candidatus Dormibacteraeota bacterium]|nr:hypothetical protein [Candidatus Dormibacteraeota bacterium]MBO0744636.1 hypothetical protein [Candidatus Dormibacteraeota bacterium]